MSEKLPKLVSVQMPVRRPAMTPRPTLPSETIFVYAHNEKGRIILHSPKGWEIRHAPLVEQYNKMRFAGKHGRINEDHFLFMGWTQSGRVNIVKAAGRFFSKKSDVQLIAKDFLRRGYAQDKPVIFYGRAEMALGSLQQVAEGNFEY